ncbi:type I toxin-antitoxin system antitoxin YafN [Candidatus Nitrotoga sp. M5]|jgi:antitoxin YafN|uniref:type I toxin-antitoxin system antitoxin YafN n=1 Tax=Candidatus Nitrotoga sp. M5 TaxID=2890409 RepID=UPI001EF44D5C|nr:type I toxin-antitoxin system antitoxin YafN [Candidatus Nitrotoga sp. M5]CAH1388321.1 antitoxin YafN [Candidatus Nitrotoga sp. M5]
MSTQSVYAEKTVALSELRKKPAEFFGDEPVAVLSHNKTAGYVIGAAAFENMVKLLEANLNGVKGQFRPSAARMKAIAEQGAELLLAASEEELFNFSE